MSLKTKKKKEVPGVVLESACRDIFSGVYIVSIISAVSAIIMEPGIAAVLAGVGIGVSICYLLFMSTYPIWIDSKLHGLDYYLALIMISLGFIAVSWVNELPGNVLKGALFAAAAGTLVVISKLRGSPAGFLIKACYFFYFSSIFMLTEKYLGVVIMALAMLLVIRRGGTQRACFRKEGAS